MAVRGPDMAQNGSAPPNIFTVARLFEEGEAFRDCRWNGVICNVRVQRSTLHCVWENSGFVCPKQYDLPIDLELGVNGARDIPGPRSIDVGEGVHEQPEPNFVRLVYPSGETLRLEMVAPFSATRFHDGLRNKMRHYIARNRDMYRTPASAPIRRRIVGRPLLMEVDQKKPLALGRGNIQLAHSSGGCGSSFGLEGLDLRKYPSKARSAIGETQNSSIGQGLHTPLPRASTKSVPLNLNRTGNSNPSCGSSNALCSTNESNHFRNPITDLSEAALRIGEILDFITSVGGSRLGGRVPDNMETVDDGANHPAAPASGTGGPGRSEQPAVSGDLE